MNLTQLLLSEFESEAKNTRRILEVVPTEHFQFRPHERSWTLVELAQHVANLPTWISPTLDLDEMDFSIPIPKPPVVQDCSELLTFFDSNVQAAGARLAASNDEELIDGTWTMRNGPAVLFSLPKHIVVRNFVLNHTVHHRAQLTVYLRLLEVPLPGIYGPTADEQS